MNTLKNFLKLRNQIQLCMILLLWAGCKMNYSFTGASISPEIKTVSIHPFPNLAQIVQPGLSQSFTEKLRDKFISQTQLSLIDRDGDLDFEGEISGYTTQPISIQGNETAASTRLTITVKVKFTNRKDEKQNFESTFSRYADFDSKLSLSSVEEELIRQVNEQLVDDIFNKAVINW